MTEIRSSDTSARAPARSAGVKGEPAGWGDRRLPRLAIRNQEVRFENSVAVSTKDWAAAGAGTLWFTRMSAAVAGFP